MAYTATQNSSGTYDVSLNGQKVTTGTSAVLGNYGLSADSLGGIQTPPAAGPVAPAGGNNTTANQAPTGPAIQQPPTPTPPTPQTTATQTTDTQTKPPQTAALSPGSTGQDVQSLQNYLVQMGYLSPQQIATGAGTYGPQTTAAVAKLQQDLGINPSSGQGYFGPQTQQALAQKYQTLHQNLGNTKVPDSAADASAVLTSALTPQSTDPVFGSMASMMEPIMNSLTQVLSNINNPALTGVSLQQEYSDMASKYNLPDMQANLLNMQNIMTGTTDDIRNEISKTGGGATESQVMAMSAARNSVILKQYNSLSTQYQAATTNVQNMMQYASQDQQTALQKQQMTANISTSLASITTQMMQMGMTMQNNARSAAQNAVTQMGYKGLAASAQGNPQALSYYESILGLAPGALSDPTTLKAMDTYKDQTLQLNNYKAAIQAFNAGYGGGNNGGGINNPGYGGGINNPGYGGGINNPGYGGGNIVTDPHQVGITAVDPSTLVRPPSVDPKVPLVLTADAMQQYMGSQKSAQVDPGTNNVVAPGIGYYVHQNDGSYVLKAALPSTTDQQYDSIKQTIANTPPENLSPTVTRKWSLTANAGISSFKDTGTYKVISQIAPYLANIRAAAQTPGSVGDLELLDSYVRASKGGVGQVTGDQVDIVLKGAAITDSASTLEQKLQNGGVLSPNQRQQLVSLAQGVYAENANDYKKIYIQAMQNLQNQGVPVQFWGNLPDFAGFLNQ